MQANEPSQPPSGTIPSHLEGIGVPDLFWSLSQARATGVLHVFTREASKKVYVSDGSIVFAASSNPNERLGEVLLRTGKIRLEQLEQATAKLPEGKRLGTLLVEAGALTPEQLVQGVVDQVRAIVIELFSWEQGESRFVEGPLPTDEVVKLDMRMPELLLDGIRSIRSFKRIRSSVGSPRTRFRAVAGWREATAGLALGEEERQMLERLEGTERSVEELCREVLLGSFETYQSLWAFRVLGLIEQVDRVPESEVPFSVEGQLDADGVAGLLVRLCRSGETGVLHLSRGGVERTIHVKDGRCVFATSNRPDDGLVAHLLRRGIISIPDQEDAARRLLSNKRVGRILLERGAIEEADLERVVREQVEEILFDSFSWERGEWTFVPGPLPTDEAITLDREIEDLVFEGLGRVTAWSRVRAGCGGLGTRLILAPGYLDVLDRMKVGPEEWNLFTNLRRPNSPRDLCHSSDLGDFRVCQVLWILRLLGVVQEAPLEDALDAAFAGRPVQWAAEAMIGSEFKPLPIEPATVPDEAPFEVTALDEMCDTADVADRAIAPSSWSEPSDDAPLGGPRAWLPEESEPVVPISAVEAGGEIVSEPWQLAAEKPPEPAEVSALAREEIEAGATFEGSDATFDPPRSEVDDPLAGERDEAPQLESVSEDRTETAVHEPWSETEASNTPDTGAWTGPEASVEEPADAPSPDGAPNEAPDATPLELGPVPVSNDPMADPAEAPVETAWSAPEDPATLERGPVSVQHEHTEVEADAPQGEADTEGPDAEGTVSDEPIADAAERVEDPEVSAEDPTSFAAWLSARGRESSALADLVVDAGEADRPGENPEAASDATADVPIDTPTVSSEPPDLDAIMSDAASALEAESPAEWTPRGDLDLLIARFNARHKLVFRVIRTEVGAGAANFVRSCRGGLATGFGSLYAEAELLPDGTWDPATLRQAIVNRRIDDPAEAFNRLLDREIERLRLQIGEARAGTLTAQVDAL